LVTNSLELVDGTILTDLALSLLQCGDISLADCTGGDHSEIFLPENDGNHLHDFHERNGREGMSITAVIACDAHA
jgi:hypothetical protein